MIVVLCFMWILLSPDGFARLLPQSEGLNYGSARFLTAKRLWPPARVGRFGYPGITDENSFNHKACALDESRPGATALRLAKPAAQPLQSGAQDLVASAADTCARSDLFPDVLFAVPEFEDELVPTVGTVCVRLTIKSARRGRPQNVSDSGAVLRWAWIP